MKFAVDICMHMPSKQKIVLPAPLKQKLALCAPRRFTKPIPGAANPGDNKEKSVKLLVDPLLARFAKVTDLLLLEL